MQYLMMERDQEPEVISGPTWLDAFAERFGLKDGVLAGLLSDGKLLVEERGPKGENMPACITTTGEYELKLIPLPVTIKGEKGAIKHVKAEPIEKCFPGVQVKVYHACKHGVRFWEWQHEPISGFDHVATFRVTHAPDCSDRQFDTIRLCDMLFKITNSVDEPWFQAVGQNWLEDKYEVTFSEVDMHGEPGVRSTSVGDILELTLEDDKLLMFQVANVGFKRVARIMHKYRVISEKPLTE